MNNSKRLIIKAVVDAVFPFEQISISQTSVPCELLIRKLLKLGKEFVASERSAFPTSLDFWCDSKNHYKLIWPFTMRDGSCTTIRAYFLHKGKEVLIQTTISKEELLQIRPDLSHIFNTMEHFRCWELKRNELIGRLEMLSSKEICSALEIKLADFLLKGLTDEQKENIKKAFS